MVLIELERFALIVVIAYLYEIHTDQGPEFTNDLLQRLNGRMGVESRFTTPYNPQSNGEVELIRGFSARTVGQISKIDFGLSPTITINRRSYK